MIVIHKEYFVVPHVVGTTGSIGSSHLWISWRQFVDWSTDKAID